MLVIMGSIGRIASLVLASVLAISAAACSSDPGAGGNASGGTNAGALSDGEEQFLRFTREEEKLARDVYRAIGAAHPSFANVTSSEQNHMDAVATLLTRYGVADPALGKDAGDFTDGTIQKLYADLVTAGSASPVAALAVGVEIEELDIADLERGKAQVTHGDIVTTMNNLTRGSRNHLRTFYSHLRGLGGSYTPKHLDRASFDAIVESAMETGGPP